MSESLTVAIDAGQATEAIGSIKRQLLERFPEASADLVHELLLRAFDEYGVLTTRPAPGAGNDVIRLQIVLADALVFEIVAAALRAPDLNGVAHG